MSKAALTLLAAALVAGASVGGGSVGGGGGGAMAPARLAEGDVPSLVVRQYTGTSHMTALIANPGPDVDGIHILSYAATEGALEASLSTEAASIRGAGLHVMLGFRIGQLSANLGCLDAQHWIDMAGVLLGISQIALPSEMIVFDGENYYTGQECTAAWVASQGSSEAALAVLMEPFLSILRAGSRRVGFYPAGDTDLVMSLILDAAADGSEAWMEHSFGTALNYAVDPSTYRIGVETTDKVWRTIAAAHPGAQRRDGHYDDALRHWGDPFRSEAIPGRAWVFDYTRSDRSSWGTSTWISGESASGLNAGILNVWPMMPLDEGGSSIPDLVSGDDLTEKWSTARLGAGYGTPGLVWREGWGQGLEWLAEGVVTSAPSAQSFRVGIKLDDPSGSRAIASIWTDHVSGNTFALWLNAGQVVLDVYSADTTTTTIVVDASPTTSTAVYVFGFDGTTVRVEGQSDTTLSSPVQTKTMMRIGLKGQTVSPVFSESSVYVGPVIRWGRLLSASEMTSVKSSSWPYGRGL